MINEAYEEGQIVALQEIEKVAGTEFAEKIAMKIPGMETAKKGLNFLKGEGKQTAQDLRMGLTGKMKIHSGKKAGQTSKNMFVAKGADKGRMSDGFAKSLKAQGMDPKTRGGYLARGAGKTLGAAGAVGAAGYGGYKAAE